MKARMTTLMMLTLLACFVGDFSFAEDTKTDSSVAKTESPAVVKNTSPTGVETANSGTVNSDSVSPDSNYIMCKNGKAVRTIRIEKKGNTCRALYTKEGVDQVVGKSEATETCQKVAQRIKVNLESGDWKCKDISQARVSSSME